MKKGFILLQNMWEVREPAIILPIYNFRTQTVGNNESYDLLLFELMFARSQVIKSNDEMGPVLIGNATFKGEGGGAAK